MVTTEELLNEYAQLAGNDDAASEARKTEILALLESRADNEETKAKVKEFVNAKLDGIESDVAALRSSICDDDYRLLPMSYIAKHYFGKSSAWLSQRINGTLVRGKVYTLNDEQKRIFNDALQDISSRIGSLRLA